ncbi:MAG: MjaI family restriction endonuclease [Promethearchaeota archaeon]
MKKGIDNLIQLKIDVKERFKQIIGKERAFPKYTTQLINIANQNAQGTRPKVVGKMSELIKKCPIKTYEGWKTWYLQNFPHAIENATDKIIEMILKMKEAMEKIDRIMIREWVEDLVINKTAEGLIIQEIILKTMAKKLGLHYKQATPEEESKNIDGFLGNQPIQIKASSYLSKKSSVREVITIPIIYYSKTEKYLTIYYDKKFASSSLDNFRVKS